MKKLIHEPASRYARPLLSLFALLLGACAMFFGAGLGGGDRIKVSHEAHKKAQIDCLACHEAIYDAKDLNDGKGDFLPPESKCLECHSDKKESGQCGFCHTDVRKAGKWPKRAPTLIVNHAKHIERVKEDCSACHRSLPEPDTTTRLTPPMSACLDCHEHRNHYNEGNCSQCHLDLGRYPLKPLSSFSHQGDFVKQHAPVARNNPEICAKCHEQTYCSECHSQTVSMPVELKYPDRVDSDFIHRPDFITRHPLEAQYDPASCRRCHGSTFCQNCHDAQNLTPFGKDPRDPHPPGYSLPGSPSFHGPAARRDITSCAGCHDQGARSVCVSCHKVGGIGGNPHPPDFTARHGQDEIHKNGMCLYCHL